MLFDETQLPETHSALHFPADEWWKSAVVYQIYPRSFNDANGDGFGDLQGIRSRLGYLKELGVDVLWLSPIYRSPQADNGYDISNYQDIDPAFGTMDDFNELIADVHALGMKLVMDLVVNHTSDEHPWFIESRSSIDNPKRDWYYWRDPRPGFEGGTPGAEPTNWGSFFSGPVWKYDPHTGQYYLHLFAEKQPDLNWENPEVRQAIYEMMRWWLDRGVDGFRMDVINLISKVPGLPDGTCRPGQDLADGSPFYMEGPRLHEFLQEMHGEVFEGRGAIFTVGETPGVLLENAPLYSDPARHEVNMIFQFEHVGLGLPEGKFGRRTLEAGDLADSLTRWQEGLAERGWNSLYLCNHDQPRTVSRFGDEKYWYDSATALATILHLLRGTPYIYQGEELGMTNTVFAGIEDFEDIESTNYYRVAIEHGDDPERVLEGLRAMGRDNARTPVQWDASDHAGFTTGTPWIALNPNYPVINASEQVGDPVSIFSYFRALIRLRHHLPVVADGRFERIDAGHREIFVFRRTLGERQLVVIANLSSKDLAPVLPSEISEAVPAFVPVLTNANVWEEMGAPLAPWRARVFLA